MKVIAAAGLIAALAGCAASAGSQSLNATAIPVEIWTGGDDGLTQRLGDAVEEEFRLSSRFSYGPAGAVPGALKVIIPPHVRWREVGDQTHVTYRLELELNGRRRSAKGGTCWESDLNQCARQVVRTVTGTVR